MKDIEQYSPAIPSIILYNAVLNFELVDEVLKYGHSSETSRAVLSCGTVYCAVQDGANV